jgi:hypothetical protein
MVRPPQRPFLGGAVWPALAGNTVEVPRVGGPPEAARLPGAPPWSLPVLPGRSGDADCGLNILAEPPLANVAERLVSFFDFGAVMCTPFQRTVFDRGLLVFAAGAVGTFAPGLPPPLIVMLAPAGSS